MDYQETWARIIIVHKKHSFDGLVMETYDVMV